MGTVPIGFRSTSRLKWTTSLLLLLLGLSTQAIQAELVTVAEDGSGDYQTLAAAVAAIPTDITGDPQEPYEIKITGTWNNPDTTGVTINNTTTDATNYIYIYTDSTARHNGKWNTGKYRLYTNAGNHSLLICEDYVRVFGLQLTQTGWSDTMQIEGQAASNEIRIAYCIARTGNGGKILDLASANAIVKVWNNVFYGATDGWAEAIEHNGGTSYIYNNTFYDNYIAITNATVAKNNIAQNCIADCFYGSFGGSSDYNISDIAGDTTGGEHDQAGVEVTFADEDNDDFRLSPADTSARDAGIDLSTDPNLSFTDDIQGQSRSLGAAGSGWDIGADEQIGVGVRIDGGVRIGGY